MMMMELGAILAVSQRDFTKLLRDRTRLVGSLVFPILFIGALGGGLQASLGNELGYDFLTFTFTGVLAQTLFTSTAQGIVSLIEDRQNDFSQTMFVSPISRFSIVFGKILGETLVAMPQGIAVIIFGLIIGISFSLAQIGGLLLVSIAASLFGGVFGLLILSNIGSQRTANQIFTFVMFPQFFLAGVFTPIKTLPLYLEIPSRIAPMRYIVDLMRGVFYAGRDDYSQVVLQSPLSNLLIMAIMFAVFIVIGTALFVRSESNR